LEQRDDNTDLAAVDLMIQQTGTPPIIPLAPAKKKE
jgi:hypothetical protein